MKIKPLLFISMTILAPNTLLAATDLAALESELDVNPVESCSDGIALYKEGDLKGALELVSLCHDEMMQLSEQMATTAFPDEVMGFTGDKIRQQSAMGFSQIERQYRNGNQTIDVSLNSGKSASMMQTFIGVSGRKTRIGKHSGFIIAENNDNSIYVPLDDRTLVFQSRTADQKLLKKFAKIFLKEFNK